MRYIDADALTEELKSLTITVTGFRSGKSYFSEIMEEYKKSILRIIDEQATADVVPRSEVEALQREIARLEKALRNSLPSYCQVMAEKQMMEIGKAYGRREVAREIFEEIEKIMERYLDSPLCNYHKIRIAFAELKKKYTEEQDDD